MTTQLLILVLVLLVVLTVVGLPWYLGRRRESQTWDPTTAYLDAIDALIRGNRNGAVESLRKIAREETDNVVAYLRLGDLVRAMGHPEKALRIHSSLAARPLDSPELHARVQESVLEDLLGQGAWDEVIARGERMRSANRKSAVALAALARAFEAKEDWEKAFHIVDEWDRLRPGEAQPRPHQLRVHAAKRHLEAGRHREARKLLEEAIKMGDQSSQARVLLGDVLAGEGEHEKAVEAWLEFARTNPERAGRVFERLERSYYEMGRFGDLLQVYEGLIQAAPDSAAAQVALADMQKRRGRPEEAIHLLESLLAHNSVHPSARELLIRCQMQAGRTSDALEQLDVLLQKLPFPPEDPVCVRCGYTGADVEPKCPRCGQWQPAPASR
jgi:lipopolysaccharide biosynthesis regulator YciM